jgi:hypothetical protein
MSIPAPLRERLVAILARHDPLRSLEQPGADAEEIYGSEAEDLAYLVAGAALGPQECASVAWAVFAQRYGPDDVGPPARYGPIGADIAATVDDSDEVPEEDDDLEDEDDLFDEGPSDPLVTAVLGILDDHDPAEIDDLDIAEDDYLVTHRRYEPAAEALADAIGRPPGDETAWTSLARDVLAGQFAAISAKRLARVGAELAELVRLADHVRADLDAVDLPALPMPQDLPGDPFCAGIVALLERFNPASVPEIEVGTYTSVAEDIAELLRDVEPDAVHCQTVSWAMVRQWASTEEAGPIAGYAALGRELATLVEMYRELASSHPDLVEPFARDGVSFLAEEPFALKVHGVLLAHDPFDLVADDASTIDYVPYARELACRLHDGSPSAGWCQVLVWKVLTDPWGGLGGSIGRFRELGLDLHALATHR